jgi:maleate isomerase
MLWACVQMPSLAAIPEVEARLELPVISVSVATTHDLPSSLGRSTVVPGAGYLLSEATAG